MPDLKAVIFDMDGLMIDSEHLHSRSLEMVLNNYGIKPELNKFGIIQTLGIGVASNWVELKKKYHIEASIDKLTKEKHDAYEKLILEIKAMPGLRPLLKDLKKAKIKMAVASGESLKNIKTILRHLEIEKYFSAIVSGEEVENPKPAPDIFLKAAKDIGIDPKSCVVLEDAPSGITAANKAGIVSVAVLTQFNSKSQFESADHIFDSLKDLSASKLKELLA